MKRYVSTNYGLAGGTLDATVHVERERERMMTPAEINGRRHDLELEARTRTASAAVRGVAGSN